MTNSINNFLEMRGKLGDLVYYKWKGKQCVRRCRSYSNKPASPSQQATRSHFKACSLMYKFLCEDFLLPWQKASATTRMNGRNLFISRNIDAFRKEGNSPDFERLHFSTGKILVPNGLSCTSMGDGQWCLSWEYDDEWTAPDDQLYVVELHSDNPLCPLQVAGITALRCDRQAVFSTNQQMGLETHLYCYWGNAAKTKFSESVYFRNRQNG